MRNFFTLVISSPLQSFVFLAIVIFGLMGGLVLIQNQQHIYSNAATNQAKVTANQLGPLNFYGKNISYLQLFGQMDYTQASKQMTQAGAAFHASGVAVTQAVKPTAIYLVDRGNSRILGWRGAGYCGDTKISCTVNADCVSQTKPEEKICIVNQNKSPDIVIGQSDFLHSACNGDANLGVKKPPSAATLCTMTFPWGLNTAEQWMRIGLATDSKGNLYVPDVENDRILKYNNPLSQDTSGGAGDAIADLVIGQNSFSKNGKNGGSFFNNFTPPNATSLFISTGPGTRDIASRGVFVDASDNLWVADTHNNRVLRFAPDQTTPNLVLGQDTFTTSGCDLQNNRKLCYPTQITMDPSSGDIYVADEMPKADFQARIQVFSPPFTNGMPASKTLTLNQGGSFENWGSFDGKGTYTPEITGLAFGPNLQTGSSSPAQLYVNGHADFRLMQIEKDGRVSFSLGSHSVRRRGGDTEYEAQYPGCGSIYNSARLWWPGGSTGVDEDKNIYIADERFHRVVRYSLPYSLRTLPSGVQCLPDPNGSMLTTGPNVQDSRGFGDMLGVAVFNNQLLVLDQYMKLKVWNDYVNKPTFASPDFIIQSGMPNRMKMTQAIDDKGRLWMSGEHGRLRIFQLPLLPDAVPVVDWVKLYWADTNELVNLEFVLGATFDPVGRHIYIIDQRGSRILRIANYADVSGRLIVDRVFGQTDKNTALCNRGGSKPTANSLCGVLQVSFDKLGNMFLLDNNYECHNNNRILAYSRHALQTDDGGIFFTKNPDYIIGTKDETSFGNCDGNQTNVPMSPVSIEFDKNGHMLIANDGMYGDQNRELRQLWLYENPFVIQLPYTQGFEMLKSPAASVELPIGASGDILFDSHDNLIVQDHTWSRLWILNYFRDPQWIVQHRPWKQPPASPAVPPTVPPTIPSQLPDLLVKKVTRSLTLLGSYTVEICNVGAAAPTAEYVIGFVPMFESGRAASSVYYHPVPAGTPSAGKCQILSGISCEVVGDQKCKTISRMTVTVDIKNQVRESNERNNSLNVVLRPTPTARPIPRPTISPL